MSKVERKEYKETKIMRTMSPTRYGDADHRVEEYDNNLDHLLADLQNTVSRPGSSLANGTSNVRETRVITSSDSGLRNKLLNVKSSNPRTEYSSDDSYSYTDPDGTKHVKTVKKESYSYRTTGGELPPEKIRMQNNINQLDSLLDDLQQVKQSGGYKSETNLDSRSRNYNQKVISEHRVVERDVGSRNDRTRSLDRSERDTPQKKEGYYGDINTTRTISSSPTRGGTSALSKQTKVTNVQQYPVAVVETSTTDINPEILASLDPELLPSGNTKVTTTIKTYTYEIPGNASPLDTTLERQVYSPNQTATTPSKSFVYNKYENNSLSRSQRAVSSSPTPNDRNVVRETVTTRNYQPPNVYYEPSGAVSSSPTPNDRNVVRETVTTRNYQPSNVYYEPSGKKTYVYNENTTIRNYHDGTQTTTYPQHAQPTQYPPSGTYIIKETHNTTSSHRGDSPDRTSLPPVNTTIHKFDSMTNLNARQYPDTETFDPRQQPYTPPSSPKLYNRQPHEPPEVTVTYKYKSTSNTTNNYKGGHPGEDQPLLPRRFPVDETEGPPKKLDDLMATIGNEPPTNTYNVGWKYHEEELAQQRKIDNLKAQQEFEAQKDDKRKEVQRSKNVTGPPVYYPPGHEMFAKKEEARGGWRAEGGMAREKGSYKYEAESKSKSKSSSGAAIVPVCLPLCCGLPCTII